MWDQSNSITNTVDRARIFKYKFSLHVSVLKLQSTPPLSSFMESLSGCCAIGGLYLSSIRANTSLMHRPSTVRGRINGYAAKCSLTNGNSPGRNPKSTIEMLEKLLYPDSAVAQENIQAPEGLPTSGRAIMDKPGCSQCDTKGLVVCPTCSGSGLYVDSILESQGIIVKVKCLGCGGSGNILCSGCGGRGHL